MDPPLDHATLITAVDQELRSALLLYADVLPRTLITMGKEALAGPGKVMSAAALMSQHGALTGPAPKWPLFVVLSYQAASSPEQYDNWREALPGAVAVEIAMAAADLLDELTDDDPSPIIAKYGPGQALNTGNLMLVMAQQTLQRAAASAQDEVRRGRVTAALGALQDMLVEAAAGQHLDMMYGDLHADEVTLEMSAEVTAKKAGALIAGSCRIGALLAGAEQAVVDLLTTIGRELGGIAQLANDIQDVLPSDVVLDHEAERKTDLRLRKRTLPIVFALREEAEEPNAVQRAFRGEADSSDNEEDLRRAVVAAGGVNFGQLIIEVHRQNVLDAIEQLEALRPGARQILDPLLPVSEET